MEGGERLLPWTRCRLWIVAHAAAGAILGVVWLFSIKGHWGPKVAFDDLRWIVLGLMWAAAFHPLKRLTSRLRAEGAGPVPRIGCALISILALANLASSLSAVTLGSTDLLELAVAADLASLGTAILAGAAFLALRVPFRKRILAVVVALQGLGFLHQGTILGAYYAGC